ncbi:hypothetical protein JKF63_07868 [Porcisia hertigi]|uniref:Uncharacterized protein n=1 Tax=Porcisia hertigi TaxID=2761500 RepID=A0A836YHK6_9TRYP|nr:hypothetical protein JKF63_07868 [Porcisia hertigi]
MISCAAIQRLERYGSLGLKRHSTEDFVLTSLKDVRRVNIYALTLLDTWREVVHAVRGSGNDNCDGNAEGSQKPARYTDALVYAVSFAVALITQHLLEVRSATTVTAEVPQSDGTLATATVTRRKEKKAAMESATPSGGSKGHAAAASVVFSDAYGQALELLMVLKDVTVAIASGRVLRSNASSDEFTKAVAHLLTSSSDLALLLLSNVSIVSRAAAPEEGRSQADVTSDQPEQQRQQQQQEEAMLAQALVLVAATAQMLRRVQATYPIEGLYYTRPCSALLKTVANKHKQLQQKLKQATANGGVNTVRAGHTAQETRSGDAENPAGDPTMVASQPRTLLDLLRRYIQLYARQSSLGDHQPSAAGLFSLFSLFQRLGLLHGALGVVAALAKGLAVQVRGASDDVRYWLTELLSNTACNRATRYVVYFREDERRLMQQNVRQASEYALFTFATTPPVDPGLVEPLLQGVGQEAADGNDEVTHTRAALVLAQWCVSVPFFFESFCQDESWASFAQEQRRLVLLLQSRARRGLEKTSRRQQRKEKVRQKSLQLDEEHGSQLTSVSCGSSDTASVHSNGGDETASLLSLDVASHANHAVESVGGSVTSLASRVSLLSTFSKHSAASYLSFISVLRPSAAAGSVTGGTGAGGGADGDDEAGVDRQLHESEDGNTNLPLILLEQLTLGLHRFMETYPAELLDRYGLRSVSWSSIARMFSILEESLANRTKITAEKAAAQRPRHRPGHGLEPPHPLFNLAQDIRYNKGMGYECLGLIFSKVVAPLLDITSSPSPSQKHHPHSSTHGAKGVQEGELSSSVGAPSDGDRTEEGFFANAAAAAATVGRAVLGIRDDPATRASVETALSTCLTAYETVAPQVIDMNLSTILRLVARAAATSAGTDTSVAAPSLSPASQSSVFVDFVRGITVRLGRNDDLPHLIDALLGRRDFASTASTTTTPAAEAAAAVDANSDTTSATRCLRAVFALPSVRQALMEAAGASLDPESLLLHLSGLVTEIEDGSYDKEHTRTRDEERDELSPGEHLPCQHDGAQVQRMLLALELVETVLAGVAPTSVSASAVLEQSTQLELLLNASFMATVGQLRKIDMAAAAAALHEGTQTETHNAGGDEIDNDRRLLVVQHMYTIRQCRAVTILCLQDLGTQQVHDYLRMLEDVLWQLTSHVGNLVGSMTLAELRPFVEQQRQRPERNLARAFLSSAPAHLELQLLPPLLVLQRLSLARAVTVALGTHAGPPEELRDMVAYLWDCLGRDDHAADATAGQQAGLQETSASLWLANQITAEEWTSLVTLGKEKHARASMLALLLRSVALPLSPEGTETPAWLSRCLQHTPAAVLRALVDAFVSLSIEDMCDASLASGSSSTVRRQWMAVTKSLMVAYVVVGHNPYWPSVLAHSLRSIKHVTHVWRKHAKNHPTVTQLYDPLVQRLISLLSCTLHSEPRAAEVLRRVLLMLARESVATPTVAALSRSGISLAYVEAIKVPATLLSDLSVPATPTTSTLAAEANGGEEEMLVALKKDVTFENELRDVCVQLFSPAFVKRIFTLTDLCASRTAATLSLPAPKTVASISNIMSTLALLYQICVAAAQASWRAKATNGNLEALMQTPAVVCLHTIAYEFYTRRAAMASSDGQSYHAASDVRLTAFLERFRACDATNASHHLFVHIASASTASETQRITREATGGGGGGVDAANAIGTPSAPWTMKVSPPSALEAVEELWRGQLRSAACTVMRLTHAVDRECAASTAMLRQACLTLRHLLACMWSSAHHKQHQMSKGGGGGGGGDSKRGRSNGDGEPTAHQSSPMAGVNAFLAEVLGRASTTGDSDGDGVRCPTGDDLRLQLEDFFKTRADGADPAAGGGKSLGHECERAWTQLLCAGGEAGIVALWLLWKLQVVSETLTDGSASVDHVEKRSQTRIRAFLWDYHDLNASVEGDAAVAATTSTQTRRVTALRASPDVLCILPSEDAPPLFHEHVHQLLACIIPGASPRATALANSFVGAAPAAAELLVHMFSVRPRLPEGQLLPHAHHLLVWLASVTTSAASVATAEGLSSVAPSLSRLCIRLCSAVAEHPAVQSASDASALTTVGAWVPPQQQQRQLDTRRSGGQSRRGTSNAHELLDSVWLVLLSLLGDSRTPHRAGTSSTPRLLREKEVVELILLLTKTWLRHSPRQQVLWSRPAMLPPLMCALFTCIMRGMELQQYSPRVLNVLVNGLAAMAAHVDAATANEGDADADSTDGDDDGGVDDQSLGQATGSASGTKAGGERRHPRTRRLEAGAQGRTKSTAVPAHVKRAVLAAIVSALFEVAHHYIHIFTAFSSDMDFLFTDLLRVLSQHFLPTATRPPIPHRAGVRIGGTVRSNVTFADLAYVCVGNAEGKSLLKQAALRMEDEGMLDGSNGGSGVAGETGRGATLTDGSRSIFRVV